MISTLADLEKKIISQLQEGIPLTKKPFEKLSQDLGISQSEYIDIIKSLKEQKIIRHKNNPGGYSSNRKSF